MVARSETGRDVKLLVDSTSCNILNWNMFWLIIVGYFAFKQPIVCGKFENTEKLNVEMQRFHRVPVIQRLPLLLSRSNYFRRVKLCDKNRRDVALDI